jgi:hypothetical protein
MTTLARSGQALAAVAGRLERGVRPHFACERVARTGLTTGRRGELLLTYWVAWRPRRQLAARPERRLEGDRKLR